MGDDGLVVAQTQVQIVAQSQQYQHEHTQPEWQAPLAPKERVVLHILRTKELIDLGGIHIDGEHLQGQTLTLILLTIHLNGKWWQIIKGIVERGECVHHRAGFESITDILLLLLALQHLNTRCNHLCGLKLRELNLLTGLHIGSESQVSLLTNKDLNRVNLSLDRYLCRNQQRIGYQRYKKKNTFHLTTLFK